MGRLVDVVIPVYRDLAATRRCLVSVLSAPRGPLGNIIVVDDASPEPELSAWLDSLAATGAIELLRNPQNLGFVASVNRGMSCEPEHDVLLLNSDTEVSGDWLTRLQTAACTTTDIATVTPFSNNATICSYPYQDWAGEGLPGRMTLAELDACFFQAHRNTVVDIPTAVGFCMYIKREALVQLGLFDEAAFGRGYGEENDFCRRAIAAGWRNVLAAGVFVFHQGSVSFGEERHALGEQAMAIIRQRYPDYLSDVGDFIGRDPLRDLRRQVDRLRAASGDLWPVVLTVPSGSSGADVQASLAGLRALGRDEAVLVCCEDLSGFDACRGPLWGRHEVIHFPGLAADGLRELVRHRFGMVNFTCVQAGAHLPELVLARPVMLHVLHSWGGGVARWVEQYSAADEQYSHFLLCSQGTEFAQGERLALYRAGESSPLAVWVLSHPIGATAVCHVEYAQIFSALIRVLGVDTLMVSSLIGHALDALASGLPTVWVAHDHYPWCAAIVMHFDTPCEACEPTRLDRCLAENSMDFLRRYLTAEEVMQLRRRMCDLLTLPNIALVAPTRGVVERLAAIEPLVAEQDWQIIPHALSLPWRDLAPMSPPRRERPLAVVLGHLHPHKGLRLLEQAMPRLAELCDIVLLGAGDKAEARFSAYPSVQVVPDYSLAELGQIMRELHPDFAILASTVPETFSYTLSELWALKVPPLATALGAFAERIQDGENGLLFAPDADSLVRLVERLLQDNTVLGHIREQLDVLTPISDEAMVSAYHQRIAALSPTVVEVDRLFSQQDFCTVLEALRPASGKVSIGQGLTAMQDQLRQAQAALVSCEAEKQGHNDALAGVLNSRSWRITRPLRWLVAKIARR